MNMLDLGAWVRHFFAPPFCFYCRTYLERDEPLCESCDGRVRPVLSTKISVEGYQLQVHAASAYEEPLKSLILAKIWSDYTAAKHLAHIVWRHSVLKNMAFDYLVPIPLHYSRYASRGFNQAYVLAKQLSELSGKPVLTCLQRSKRTQFQSAVLRAQRHKNIQGAFNLVETHDLEGKTIVFVDDLVTTGATLYEAGRAVAEGCPKEMHAIVACRIL